MNFKISSKGKLQVLYPFYKVLFFSLCMTLPILHITVFNKHQLYSNHERYDNHMHIL